MGMDGGGGGGGGLRLSFPHSVAGPTPLAPPTLQEESPTHSHHNSWAIDEEEDPELRAEFPDANGHLFSVTLNKGSGGLGLNIVSETSSKAVRGIVIMGIQSGGVADQCGRIRWGDVILKMNHVNVVGMSQEQFQKLLMQAPPTVTFVLLRQIAETPPAVRAYCVCAYVWCGKVWSVVYTLLCCRMSRLGTPLGRGATHQELMALNFNATVQQR